MPRKRSKIIGVDAGCLGVTDQRLKVGVYRVAYNLLKELGKIDRRNQYRLYSFNPIEQKVMRGLGKRMENVVLKPRRGWFRLRLPLELKLRPVDIFLGLSQALPSSSSHNILLVHDLAFEHYPDFYPGSYQKLAKNTRRSVKIADQILAVSDSTKKDLVELYGAPEKKITVSYQGVGKNFSPQGESFKLKAPYFLFVGTLKKRKNIPLILKGFAHLLKKTRSKFKLVLVGCNLWFDSEIPKTVKTFRLEDKILITGFVNDQDLPKFYRGAVAFVSPSLYEGGGLTHLEAMACGTPVIAANVSSMPEMIGRAGILVNPQREREIGDALVKTAFDNKLRVHLIKKGISRAKKFTWQKFASRAFKLIENC